MLRRRRKDIQVDLGTIRVPSGELVVIDAGYLGAWSGTGQPSYARLPTGDDEELQARLESLQDQAVDLRVVGRDAEAAARAFDRQSLTYLYDLLRDDIPSFRAQFDSVCREHGFDARLDEEPATVPHRERVRRCAQAGGAEFLMFGVPVVAIGGIPSDRDLRVTGTEVDFGGRVGARWAEVRVHLREDAPAGARHIGGVGVDWARMLLGDADALGVWQHDKPVDGLADVVFRGAGAEDAARAIGARAVEDGGFGWTDLGWDDLVQRGEELDQWTGQHPDQDVKIDFRPHSHHWVVLEQARRSPHGVGTIDLDGARLLMFFTSWGDGIFPVVVETSASGLPVAVRIQLGDDERRRLLEDLLG